MNARTCGYAAWVGFVGSVWLANWLLDRFGVIDLGFGLEGPAGLLAAGLDAGTPGCLFAVVPDVVGDSEATDARWSEWAPLVKSLGYRPAYVTQNGCTAIPEDAGAVFTGGDDAWKLGAQAQALVADARSRGLWCHMGRVNSLKRLRFAAFHGYHSVDGTFLGRTCQGGERIRELIPGWRCDGRLEVHEPLTRARGGDPTDPDQCVLLCARCHAWAHREPVLAAEVGLLRHSWDQPKGDTCKSST